MPHGAPPSLPSTAPCRGGLALGSPGALAAAAALVEPKLLPWLRRVIMRLSIMLLLPDPVPPLSSPLTLWLSSLRPLGRCSLAVLRL